MEDYIQVTFVDTLPEQQELLIAQLAETGFEGFEQAEKELKAFIPEKKLDKDFLISLAGQYKLVFSFDKIESRNWNEVWESNFQPVVIDDFVAIRADFHPPFPEVNHEIIITPKMSFGTGHHATTCLVIKQMKAIEFTGKSVLDFGTGTGILAILAEKLGARKVVAIDNDEWSIENAKENIQRNASSSIIIEKADNAALSEKFDVILANINKNVILENLGILIKQMKTSGVLLVSGILKGDLDELLTESRNLQLQMDIKTEKDNWLCIRLSFN